MMDGTVLERKQIDNHMMPAAYTNRAAMQERERERERAVKCEDLNDSSTPYKLEIMMKTIKN